MIHIILIPGAYSAESYKPACYVSMYSLASLPADFRPPSGKILFPTNFGTFIDKSYR